MAERTDPLIIVSNRGPASFVVSDDGGLEERRGAGGLVSGLASLGEAGASWSWWGEARRPLA